jgi:surfeit locus 1 family protein
VKFLFHKFNYFIGPYRWRCIVPLVASYFCLLILFISAGFWQLDRADQKQILLRQQSQAQTKQAFIITDTVDYHQDMRYARVTLTGKYDQGRQFLIDNQVLNRRAGYFVMTPFLPERQQISVLVNRGWVPANLDRSILPELSIQNINVTLSGRINNFPSVGIKLAGAEMPGQGWPSLVQLVDSQQLANKLKYPLHNFQVQLSEHMADGYQRNWKSAMTRMPPEKHIAYAMQWFSFALVLTVIFVILTIKKVENESETHT